MTTRSVLVGLVALAISGVKALTLALVPTNKRRSLDITMRRMDYFRPGQLTIKAMGNIKKLFHFT